MYNELDSNSQMVSTILAPGISEEVTLGLGGTLATPVVSKLTASTIHLERALAAYTNTDSSMDAYNPDTLRVEYIASTDKNPAYSDPDTDSNSDWVYWNSVTDDATIYNRTTGGKYYVIAAVTGKLKTGGARREIGLLRSTAIGPYHLPTSVSNVNVVSDVTDTNFSVDGEPYTVAANAEAKIPDIFNVYINSGKIKKQSAADVKALLTNAKLPYVADQDVADGSTTSGNYISLYVQLPSDFETNEVYHNSVVNIDGYKTPLKDAECYLNNHTGIYAHVVVNMSNGYRYDNDVRKSFEIDWDGEDREGISPSSYTVLGSVSRLG